ncbi:hypothetical protein K8S17_02940 [bacterium]|nr:hypothetical protein [bacterium]
MLAVLMVLGAGCARKGDPVSGGDDDALGYRLVATVSTTGYAEGVTVAGGLGFVATAEVGLVMFDMTEPSAPVYIETASNNFTTEQCAYAAESMVAFMTDGPNGVLAYDVSDPANPEWKTVLQSTSGQDVVVAETDPGHLLHAYVADKNGGFRIWELNLDWGPPWFPIEVYHGYTTGYARGLCLHGDHVLVASGQGGLTIYELTSPEDATKLGTFDTPGNAQAVTAAGNYAFVADGLTGVQIFDISNPENAFIVAAIVTDDYAGDIATDGEKLYVADRYGGLRVVDVSDPLAPTAAGYLNTPYASGVCFSGDYVYLADRDWGLVIVEEE